MSVLRDRAVIRASGPEAASFLQGVTTQDIAALKPMGGAFAALLAPQGKIIADFFVQRVEDAYLIDCAKTQANALLAQLMKYRLRAKVELAPAPDLFVRAGDEGRDGRAYRDPRLAGLGWRTFSPDSADDSPAFDDRALRFALGVPECGPDFGADEYFLLDVNYDALNAVSYSKGCFIGQEVTSRMKRKGEIRRRTLIARFDGAPPPKGTEIAAGGATIGVMLSGMAGCGLACVRVDRLDEARAAGEPCRLGDAPVELVVPAYLTPSMRGTP